MNWDLSPRKGKGELGRAPSVVLACAGMTERAQEWWRGHRGGERDVGVGGRESRRCERGLARGSRRSTPHLTSPLEGGRDELGPLPCKEEGVNWGASPTVVPACAGMTERAQE